MNAAEDLPVGTVVATEHHRWTKRRMAQNLIGCEEDYFVWECHTDGSFYADHQVTYTLERGGRIVEVA